MKRFITATTLLGVFLCLPVQSSAFTQENITVEDILQTYHTTRSSLVSFDIEVSVVTRVQDNGGQLLQAWRWQKDETRERLRTVYPQHSKLYDLRISDNALSKYGDNTTDFFRDSEGFFHLVHSGQDMTLENIVNIPSYEKRSHELPVVGLPWNPGPFALMSFQSEVASWRPVDFSTYVGNMECELISNQESVKERDAIRFFCTECDYEILTYFNPKYNNLIDRLLVLREREQDGIVRREQIKYEVLEHHHINDELYIPARIHIESEMSLDGEVAASNQMTTYIRVHSANEPIPDLEDYKLPEGLVVFNFEKGQSNSNGAYIIGSDGKIGELMSTEDLEDRFGEEESRPSLPILPPAETSSTSSIIRIALIAIGMILLVLAVRKWRFGK